MHSSFRKYLRIFSAYWSSTIQYRGDFFMWGIAQSITPLISLAIWYTVATTADISLTPQQTLAYFVAVVFLNNIIHGPDGFLFGEDILQGKIVQHLMKPYQTWLSYLIRGLEIRFVFMLILLPVLLLLAAVAPQLFAGLVLKPATLLLFACSVLLGMGVFFVFDMLLATTAFWFEESHEIRRFRHVAEAIASGVLIPYVLMPDSLRTWLSYLPFRYILSTPAEIISGQIRGLESITLVGIQAGWILGLAVLFRFAWIRGLKIYAIPTQ